jgi:transcriptional regulator with XRE-family HTH domain
VATTSPTRLALRIKEARVGTTLSQKKFAQRIARHLPAGYRPPTRFDVMRWEKGDEPRFPMLVAIARASGKPLDFFGDEDEEEESLYAALREDLRAIVRAEIARTGREKKTTGSPREGTLA